MEDQLHFQPTKLRDKPPECYGAVLVFLFAEHCLLKTLVGECHKMQFMARLLSTFKPFFSLMPFHLTGCLCDKFGRSASAGSTFGLIRPEQRSCAEESCV